MGYFQNPTSKVINANVPTKLFAKKVNNFIFF